MGWATPAPVSKGGQDAHPTKLGNLFVGSPLCGNYELRIINYELF
ncbi:hypothetical protein GXM_03043 [Nostoc sphaeroides CCNUC1]|uniref:Uncharacterized protein n=1 Tax=Nostoc sphaeroides CCNUC1 TaxID=2653204 RepID=A0A5P8VZU7_9NOSO|nr:hypothetical protein GXM_03043 [Nostoc sphaeroides CCNUC1]